MFDIRYNIVNLIRVILSVLNLFFMLRVLGVSQGSDIYLLAFSIITSWQYIPLLFMGQFIPFYNDAKVKSIESAHKFFNQTIIYSAALGLILFLVAFIFAEPLVRMYTINLDIERFGLLISVVRIMSFSMMVIPIELLLEHLFIAEKKFFWTYTLNIIILICPVLALTYMFVSNSPSIKLLAISYSFAIFAAAILGLLICCKKYIPFKISLNNAGFIKFISNSFTVYTGQALYVCLLPLVLNNFLIYFTSGIISCFYYSKNAISATNMILTDFSNKNITAELSSAIAKHENIENIKKPMNKYLRTIPLIFFVLSLIAYFAIPTCFKIIFYKSSILLNVDLFANIFLSLVPWFVINLISCPFYFFNSLSKKSHVIMLAYIVSIAVLAVYLYLCPKKIYNISLALACGELIYLIVHYLFAKKHLVRFESEVTKKGIVQ